MESLVPDSVSPKVEASLRGLERKELIRPDEATFAGQDAYRFQHILIRDAAYHGLLKRTRAELHERFVDWLEQIASDRVMEFEEIRGYHLEQAYVIRISSAHSTMWASRSAAGAPGTCRQPVGARSLEAICPPPRRSFSAPPRS